MITLVRQPTAVEPDVWFLVFHTRAATPWANKLPGRFKHVSAFAYVHAPKCWLICDVQMEAFRQIVLPDNTATLDYLALMTDGCTVLHMRRLGPSRLKFRIGFWCVPAIKHLLGLRSGALRPDRLYRDCLRAGAKLINEPSPIPGAGRSEPASRDGCGEHGQGGCAIAAAEV